MAYKIVNPCHYHLNETDMDLQSSMQLLLKFYNGHLYLLYNVNVKKGSGGNSFTSGWQGCFSEFYLGFALRKFLKAAFQSLVKTISSLLFSYHFKTVLYL